MSEPTIGSGKISGTVTVLGVPTANIEVDLYRTDTKEYIMSTLTDVLGEYEFNSLNVLVEFDVIARGASVNKFDVIKNRRRPV